MNSAKILVVEDEFILAEDLAARLQDLGYDVVGTAATAEEALEAVDSKHPDLVLMDVRLKGAVDGVAAAGEIRKKRDVPVIFLTAYADDSTLRRAREAEPFGYILKPFEDRELRSNIEIALYKHRADAEIRHLSRLYLTLSQMNQAIVRTRSREKLLSEICKIAVQFGGFKIAWIGMLDDSGRLLPVAQAGEEHGIVLGTPLQHCSCLAAVREGRTWVENHAAHESAPVCQAMADQTRLKSCAASPLRVRGSVCGMVVVGTSEPQFFHGAEVNLLDEIVQDISLALETIAADEQRQAAQAALAQREEHLRTILQTALDGFLLIDTQGRFLEMNDTFCRMLGYSREELLRMGLADIESTETEWQTAEHMRRIIRQGSDRFETRHRRKDGSVLDVVVSVTYRDFGGGRFIVFLHDIGERKRAESELKKSEAKFRSYIQDAPTAILVADAEGVFVEWNRAALELLGCDDAAIARMHAWEIHLPEDREAARRIFDRVISLGSSETELPILRKDGGRRWVWLKAVETTDQRTIGFLVDITQRKQTEQELLDSRERLEAVLDAAQLGIFSRDLRTGKGSWDERTKAIFGIPNHEEMTSEKFFALLASEDRNRVQVMPGAYQGKGQTVQYRITLPSGETRWVQARGNTINDAKGKPARTLGVLMDITEQKKAEQEMHALTDQLRHAQKLEALGRLAGGVAHDFNNLLMVIRLYAEMVHNDAASGDALRKKLHPILEAADRAANLTAQLLAFSRKQITTPKAINLNQIMTDTVKMLKRLVGEDVDLKFAAAESLWTTKADPDQVVQVLMNLCVNSRDAMPHGGTLTIATANATFPETVAGIPAGRYVHLSVADTGVGISKELHERIFEPFFTTKETGKGTGLGLSTVYGIVRQSNGFVMVDSEPGSGACFNIYLPVATDAPETAAAGEPDFYEMGTETLLLVEDEDSLREVLVEFLEGLGYTVLAAASGMEAVSIMEERGGVDLLVTDLVMPHMSGRQLSEILEGRYPGLKALYMSGYTDDAVIRTGIELANLPFLRKPFNMGTLARKVREALGKSQ